MMKVHVDAKWLQLGLGCVLSIFMSNMLSIPALGLFAPALFLSFTTTAWNERSGPFSFVGIIIAGTVPFSLCSGVGAADYIAIAGRAGGWGIGSALAFPMNFLMSSACMLHVAFNSRFESPLAPLVFPTAWTALWQLWSIWSPFGIAGNPAMTLSTFPSMLALASLFGELSIIFLISWTSVILLDCASLLWGQAPPPQHQAPTALGTGDRRISRTHQRVYMCTVAALAVYGEGREVAGRGFGLRDVSTWPESSALLHSPHIPRAAKARTVQVSCLLGDAIPEDPRMPYAYNSGYANLVDRTTERLRAGDDVVMWSEAAGWDYAPVTPARVIADAELNANASRAAALGRPPWSRRALVAATYVDYPESAADGLNTVAWLQGNRTMQIYHKAHPVPIMEPGIRPGGARPGHFTADLGNSTVVHVEECEEEGPDCESTEDSALTISTAICFDFDFPDTMRSAAGADVVLGPSNYWASIGYAIWGDNVFRAAENGFTLFKCSRDGVTGAVNPWGQVLSFKPTLAGDVFTAQIPVHRAVWTLYAHGGFLFGYVCVAFLCIYLVLMTVPMKRLETILPYGGATAIRLRPNELADTADYTALLAHDDYTVLPAPSPI